MSWKIYPHPRGPTSAALALLAVVSTGGGPPGPPASGPSSPGTSATASALTASALPDATLTPPTAGRGQAPAAGASAERFATGLFPGQVLQPIDLAGALRLAGAQNPDIALARAQVFQAVADLDQARALWLPSLFVGPTFYRVDGQVQNINGQVQTVSRGSLFLGATATLANGFPAPSPGTGFPALNGLSTVLRLSDAIFEPKAAGRVVAANKAGLRATANDTLLAVAESYFDLQQAAGSLAIAREAEANARSLAYIAGTYAETGQGLKADARRAQTDYQRRRREIRGAIGRLKVASAELVRPLLLDPRAVLAPVEPAEAVIRLVPDDVPLERLLAEGLCRRPELARASETVGAADYRLTQAKLRPFVPSVAAAYAGGGFGGGQNAFFGNFSTRGDLSASVFWDVRNLYVTDRAIVRRRKAEREAAGADVVRVRALVASEVVASYEDRAAASGQMVEAGRSVTEALDSVRLNFENIRQGQLLKSETRPIEVLQPIQALSEARAEYLDAVLSYNRAQFRLYRALGRSPSLDAAPPPVREAETEAAAGRPGPGPRVSTPSPR